MKVVRTDHHPFGLGNRGDPLLRLGAHLPTFNVDMSRHIAAAVLASLITVALFGSTVDAAPATPDHIELDFPAFGLDYDATTDQLVVEGHADEGSSCSSHQLNVLSRSGEVQWVAPATGPCHWLVQDGVLFVATMDTIESFDMATGDRIRQWPMHENTRAAEMFLGGPSLYFNELTLVNNRWQASGVASLNPAVDDSLGRGSGTDTLVALSSDSRFLWLINGNLLTRFDQAGQTDLIDMPTLEIPAQFQAEFFLSTDEQFLYSANGQSRIIDANTLEILVGADEAATSPSSFRESSTGHVIGVGDPRNLGAVTIYTPGTLDPIASGPTVTYGNPDGVEFIGERVAVLDDNRIAVYAIAPTLTGVITRTVDANNAQTISIGVTWLGSVEQVFIDGQSIPFVGVDTDFNGDDDWYDIDLPALTEGTHPIAFDGPLGRSEDAPENTITVSEALNRSRLEVLNRADSAVGEVSAGAQCWDESLQHMDLEVDTSVTKLLRAGERFVVQPIVGHTCVVSFGRVGEGAGMGDEWHLTTGYFNVDADPGAWNMLDIEGETHRFTMPAIPLGVATFLPEFDQNVLWTYSYGFGAPPTSKRSPVTLDCPAGIPDRTYETRLGYWVRTVLPRYDHCQIQHATPDGAVGSGFGRFDAESGIATAPNGPATETYPGSSDAVNVVVIYDVYPHPSEHNGAFARQQYRDFLGREGDAAGLRFWEDALNTGARQRTDLVQLFLDSPEFGGTVAPVSRLYQAYFDRAPDREGLFFWVDWIRSDRTLEQASDEFARSPEFARTYGSLSDGEFIDLVYRNVLGRVPDSAGRAFWADRMSGGLSRGQLMVSFSESPEYIDQTRSAVLVESLYQGLLQRSPDGQGFEYWTGVADSGEPVTNLIAGMLSSDEYFNRFDGLVDDFPAPSVRGNQIESSALRFDWDLLRP